VNTRRKDFGFGMRFGCYMKVGLSV